MSNFDSEAIAPLLHGTARAWRLKLDARLKPMGFTQAKWRTLLHLSLAADPLTQAEIAARLGIEEPTLVTLLHRLEKGGLVTRKNASHDRRCKTVHIGKRAHRIIARINGAAAKLRGELLAGISLPELKICMRVLGVIRDRAETQDKISRRKTSRQERNGHSGNGHALLKVKIARRAS